MLRELAPDLWIADQRFRYHGLDVGAHMTVVRLPGSQLLLHSPIERSAELEDELRRLGEPSILVAPNHFHHLFIQSWFESCPKAQLHAAPGLRALRPDLPITATLGNVPDPDWCDVLDQALLGGVPAIDEVVFFHEPSGTLIASDLLLGPEASDPTSTRIFFGLLGTRSLPSSPLLERVLVRDRPRFRRALERILAWPIERIVMSHGDVFEGDGCAAIRRAYAWMLDDGAWH